MTLNTRVMAAEFSFAITRVNYILKILILNCSNISHNYCFYPIFDQINAALVCVRDKNIKRTLPKLLHFATVNNVHLNLHFS